MISLKASNCSASEPWNTICNGRFGECISVPKNFIISDPSSNGDGFKFSDNNGMSGFIAATNNLETIKISVLKAYKDAKLEHPNATYKAQKEDWLALSGLEKGNIYYIKNYVRNKRISYLYIEYPKSKRLFYNKVVQKLVGSFRPATEGVASCWPHVLFKIPLNKQLKTNENATTNDCPPD